MEKEHVNVTGANVMLVISEGIVENVFRYVKTVVIIRLFHSNYFVK